MTNRKSQMKNMKNHKSRITNHKYMGHSLERIELHVIPVTPPAVRRAVEQIFDDVGVAFAETVLPDGQLNPAMLHVMRIGVGDHEHASRGRVRRTSVSLGGGLA